MSMKKTVTECLTAIGISQDDHFDGCSNVEEEFVKIKRFYHRKILACHPDKGGDPAEFRSVRTSFEVLREMYDNKKVSSFASSGKSSVEDAYTETWNDFRDKPTPPWDFFYRAAEEEVPIYRVELAKSGRSKCKQTGKKAKKCEDTTIEKGEIRVGSIDDQTGSYGRWNHVPCWRVPSKVWLGLPDPCNDVAAVSSALAGMNEVLLSGFSQLPPQEQETFACHVMNKENWARLIKRKPKQDRALTVIEQDDNAPPEDSRAMVPEGYHVPRTFFEIPVPGKNGAVANVLQGKTIVLTGTFPEVGGGRGFNLGKDKVKAMISTFGGRVTGSISGKTDLLVVGKEPGFCSVSQARSRDIQLLNLGDLKNVLEGTVALEDAQEAVIGDFSAGYVTSRGSNSLALQASAEEIAIARGEVKPDKKQEKKRKTKVIKVATYDITCDKCGIDCTERSWFVEESDYCESCYANLGEKGVQQSHGVTVEEKTAAKRRKQG